MAMLGPNNALAWAHFRLRGGLRRSLLFTIGASVIVMTLIYGGVHFSPQEKLKVLAGWSTGLFALQAAIMALYVGARISAAIRQDVTSKIIESHRLMPTSAFEAVVGYITGAASQPLVLSAAIFLIGAGTCAGAQYDVGNWILIHGVLLGFCIGLWSLAAYVSFTARFGPALIFLPMFFGPVMIDGGGFSAAPGLMVLLSPIFGQSIFDLRSATGTLPPTYAIALAAQFYFAAIFLAAAARRYRSVDGVGIDTLLGLLLVVGWVVISCVGLHDWENYRPGTFRRNWVDPETQVIMSMALAMLLALLPVAASAWSRRRWWLHRAMNDPSPMGRPIPAIAVLAAITLAITLIPLAEPTNHAYYRAPHAIDFGRTAVILALAFTAVYFLCSWVYMAYHRAGVAIVIWLLLAWGAPIVVDLIHYGLAESRDFEQIASIASCSPIGALIIIWDPNNHHTNPTPGIVMQLLIASLPFVLCMIVVMRRRARRARL